MFIYHFLFMKNKLTIYELTREANIIIENIS